MKPKHCISVKYKPPRVVNEMTDWCIEHFGQIYYDNGDVISSKWVRYWSGPSIECGTEHKFWFTEHKDAVLFSLRWE